MSFRFGRLSPFPPVAVLALVLVTALPSAAHANIPLPTLFGFMMPAWLGFVTLGISLLLVIAVEGVMLKMALKSTFRHAVAVAFLMNVVSTAVGFFLAVHPLEVIALLVIPTIAGQWVHRYLKWRAIKSIALGIVLFAVLLAVMMPWGSVPAMVMQVYVTFGVSFLLTLLFEACWIARDEKVERPWRAAILANGASYALILTFLFFTGFRSGAVGLIDWPLHQLVVQGRKHDADRRRVTAQIQELYEWQSSGNEWRQRLGPTLFPHQPWIELRLVENWAKKGSLQDARELFAVIEAHCPRSETDEYLSKQWLDAEKAISSATTKSNKQQPPPKEQPT